MYLSKEDIGYKTTDSIVRMLLISSHDHDFWYEREDGTWYGYSKRKDHDPEEWFWEVEGRQMELKFDVSCSLVNKYNVCYTNSRCSLHDLLDLYL